jgi:hypothetical protein
VSTAKSIPPGILSEGAHNFMCVGVDRSRQVVAVSFERDTTGLDLTAADARAIAEALLRAADEIEAPDKQTAAK